MSWRRRRRYGRRKTNPHDTHTHTTSTIETSYAKKPKGFPRLSMGAPMHCTTRSCSFQMMDMTREVRVCDGECTTWSGWWLEFDTFWGKICTLRSINTMLITIVHHPP